MLRLVTAFAALGLTACAASAVSATGVPQPQGQRLSDSTFIASYPGGWTKQISHPRGSTHYALASKGTLNAQGLPEAGAVGISVTSVPIALLQSSGVKNASTLTLSQLAGVLLGVPLGATSVATVEKAHTAALGGESGLEAELSYTVATESSIQQDILVKHGAVAYVIELDVAASLRAEGEADLSAMASSWGWLA